MQHQDAARKCQAKGYRITKEDIIWKIVYIDLPKNMVYNVGKR